MRNLDSIGMASVDSTRCSVDRNIKGHRHYVIDYVDIYHVRVQGLEIA